MISASVKDLGSDLNVEFEESYESSQNGNDRDLPLPPTRERAGVRVFLWNCPLASILSPGEEEDLFCVALTKLM